MSIADIYAKKNDDDLADDLAYFACEGGGTEGSRSAMFEAARRLRDRPAPTPSPPVDPWKGLVASMFDMLNLLDDAANESGIPFDLRCQITDAYKDACDRWLAIPLDERTAARKVGAS